MPNPGPLIHNPISDFSALFDQQTRREQCRPLAIQYARCQDAYGFPHHLPKCRDEWEDLQECSKSLLKDMRARAIKTRRAQLHDEGKLDQRYIVPPVDSISQEHGFKE